MKSPIHYVYNLVSGLLIMCLALASVQAQDTAPREIDTRPVKNMFESIWLIDNQTVVVPYTGTFEFDILHRFGTVKNGYEDLFGLYAPANIRLGLSYVPFDNFMMGLGVTKANLTWDFNMKYAFMQQSRSGGNPFSLTYYMNIAFDTRDKELYVNPYTVAMADRVSYLHQLMFARKFTENLSVQVAPSLIHFNTVDARESAEEEVIDQWENDHFAVAVLARYKVASWVNIIFNYDQPLSEHVAYDPKPNVAFGIELTSSSHQFQIFAGNYYGLVPQRNNVFNTNSIGDGEILIGFNITRLWNF